MAANNFSAALAFVWQPQYDSPKQGYHVTPGDPGGGTFGGIIEATWAAAAHDGLVHGLLKNASTAQLSLVMQKRFWEPVCEKLPPGIDLLVFNGTMMSGRFAELFQQCLGLTGDDVDGWIGKFTQAVAANCDPATLIRAVHGTHYAYLESLPTWGLFGNGWSGRLLAARDAAMGLVPKEIA